MARPDREARAEYIAQQAAARGIDPEIAVAVAAAEGLNAPGMQSNISASSAGKTGVNGREPSFGDFQMLTGRDNDYGPGLGDEMINQTGVDPREETSWKESINFALDNVVRDGWDAWAGAKAIGVGKWDGVSANAVELGVFSQPEAQPQAKPDRDAQAVQTAQAIDSFGMPGTGIPNMSAMNDAPTSVNALAPTIDTVAVDPFEAVINDTQETRGGAGQAATATGAPFGRPDADYVQTQELAYLGDLDGLFDYGLQNQESRTVNVNGRSKTFDNSYFDINNMDPTTAYAAARAFDQVGVNPGINSSYRGAGYNEAVGGARGSQHKGGRALDISRNGLTMDQQVAMLDSLMEQGFQGIGIGRGIIHADTRQSGPAIWDYNNTIPPELMAVYNDRTKGNVLGQYPSDFAFIGTPQAKPDRQASAPAVSPELSNYASFVSNNDALGRGTAPGRSYVDVDLDDFAVVDPFAMEVDRAAATRGGIGATPATAYAPTTNTATLDQSIIDGYQEYANSRGSGLAPLEAPQEIGVRAAEPAYTIDSIPGLDWATNQNSAPSIGTAATAATAPTSNVATPQGNQQQGGGFFGQIGDALGGIMGSSAVKGGLVGASVAGLPGLIGGGVIGGLMGRDKDKDKDKDKETKGRGRGFGSSTLGMGAKGLGIGGTVAGLPGAVIGGALGTAMGLSRNGMPSFGGIGNIGTALGTIGNLGSNPSVGHAALGYAMDQARANPNYTGIDFSRDFASRGGQISNGRPEPGKITAAEFNAGQREVGKAKSVAEGFSEDAGEALGGCFLTTAAVDVTGEADNGDTLQTLRWFRDNIMRARPDWSEDVDEYYRIAPAIVERLNGDKATYERLMKEHIRPAVSAIKAGKYETAYRVYRAMVDDLQHA